MIGIHSPAKHFPRKAAAIAGILLLLLVIGYSLLQVTLRSPFVISWAEQYFSEILQQPVSLKAMDLQFRAVTLQGITVANPPGFAAGTLVTVRKISVIPAWTEIIGGKKVVKEITIAGVAIDLTKNQQGGWNYGPLLDALKKGRKDGDSAEIIIRRLEVQEASLTVNGRRRGDLAVTVADIATKGSMATSLALSADLPGMGRIKGAGTARLGPEPVADLTLEAPSLALSALPAPKALVVADGTGRLALKAQLKKGMLTADLHGGITGTMMVVRNHPVPLEGSIRTSFRYDTTADTLDLGQSLLQVNRLLNVRATGKVDQLKTARRFTGHIVTDPLSIAALVAEVPARLRPQIAPSGRLLPLQLRIAGDGTRGITDAQGRLSVRDGEVARKGAVMMRDFAADLEIARSVDGWQLNGKLTQGSSGADLPIRDITGSFAGKLTESFRITEFSADDMRADLFGGKAVGHAKLQPSAGVPFTAALRMQDISLQQFNRFFDDKMSFDVGALSATAEVAGRTNKDFNATLNMEVKGASGRSGDRQFSVRQATTEAAVDGTGGAMALAGTMEIQEGTVAGKKVDASFRYEGTREKLALEQGKLRLADLDVQFDRIAGGLPRLPGNDTRPVPIRIDFRGVTSRKGDLGVHGMGGMVHAEVHRANGRIWVSGGAEVAGASLHFRRQEIGTVGVRLMVNETQAEAKLSGTLLGGNLSAEGRGNPYLKNAPILFSGKLVQAEAVRLATFAPASPYRVAGQVDGAVEGAYGTEGMAGTITLSGTGLSVAGGKKTIVSDAGFTVRGNVQGDTVTVKESRTWIGPEVAAHFSGEVRRAFSPARQGVMKVAVPTTSVTALFDAFANILPRALQEASATGTVAADSVLRLRGKEMQLDGNAAISGAFDIPAQQVSVSGIRGTVPFSVVLPALQKRVPLAMQHPSRESYSGYLHFLQHGPHQGNPLAIEKIRFGPLDLAQTTIRLEAADGVIRINSFRTSLAEGVLVGRGYFGPGAAGQYGGDLLVNDLSLRAFCAQIPAIKDYISGKVDGIVSVAGAGKGVAGLTAFIDLWARGTKEEKMLVSKEFLQKLAGKNLRGLFFRKDRPYDRGEISGYLEKGYLTFETLDIAHTNFFGVRDLSVSVAPVQNKISLDHLVNAVKEAAARGKGNAKDAGAAAPEAEFNWEE